MKPNTELINAPAIEAPKLNSYAAIVRGLATAAQNWGQVSVKVLKKIVEIGISTTIPRYARAKPRVRPNPGSTLVRLVLAFNPIARMRCPDSANFPADRSCRRR